MARRDSESAKARREDELLERALTSSPDYAAAVRRTATVNIEAETPPAAPGQRRRTEPAQAREQRISTEEARLSDAVEHRRRERIAKRQREESWARAEQARAACQARGAQMEAAYYNPRDFLNLEAIAAGNQARNACVDAFNRTGMVP